MRKRAPRKGFRKGDAMTTHCSCVTTRGMQAGIWKGCVPWAARCRNGRQRQAPSHSRGRLGYTLDGRPMGAASDDR
jgi:hypothetical protein